MSEKVPTSEKNRLNLLNYPQFQLSLIVGNTLIIASVLLMVFYMAHSSFNQLIEKGAQEGLPHHHPYFQFLDHERRLIFTRMGVAALLGIGFDVFWLLHLSNKIVGPIVRLRTYFRSLNENQTEDTAIRFRKNDFFLDLPPLINQYISKRGKK